MSSGQTATDGWDAIIDQAGIDNEPSRAKANLQATQKQVMAFEDLASAVFTAQKHISARLDSLNQTFDANEKSSTRLAKKTFWLTIFLVIATIVQAAAAVLVIGKK